MRTRGGLRLWLVRLRWLTDGLFGAAMGAAIYAVWAYFVNLPHGVYVALKISLPHWLLATILTYYGTAMMRFCYRLGYRFNDINRTMATFFGGMIITYGILVPVHMLIGTPDIFMTLAAGMIPTFIFCLSYAMLLIRTESTLTNRAVR